MEHRKKWLVLKYALYFVIFVLLYVLQNIPGLFTVYEVKPVLLIPAAVVLACFEGEFIGGLYGALAGLLCDTAAFSLFGYDGIFVLVCCVAAGLLVIYLLRQNLSSAFMLVGAVMTLRSLGRFFFQYVFWGYEQVGLLFWKEAFWVAVYSTLLTPLYFWLWKRLVHWFRQKLEQ